MGAEPVTRSVLEAKFPHSGTPSSLPSCLDQSNAAQSVDGEFPLPSNVGNTVKIAVGGVSVTKDTFQSP